MYRTPRLVSTIDYHAVSEVHFNEFHRYLQAYLAKVPFLPFREEFHPKRNQARQKLATLPITRFEDLSSDVYFETVRRYPEFREDSSPRRTSADLPGDSEYGNSDSEYGGSERDDSSTNQTNLTDVSEHMDPKIFVVPQLVLLLQNPDSYKYFLACPRDRCTASSGPLTRCLHPRCFALCGLQKVGQQVTGGGFADIWKGLIHGQSVSVKIMRIFEDSDVETVLKEFSREALIWRQLCHPNVCLVSPWMENGHIVKFLKNKNPSNKARLSLILDVALGLRYLHEKNVVHGDLKGSMVIHFFRPVLLISGVSSITNAMTVRFIPFDDECTSRDSTLSSTPNYSEEKVRTILSSDVYCFACVCYEERLSRESALRGQCRAREQRCLTVLWELLQKCWGPRAEMRSNGSSNCRVAGVGPSIGAKPTLHTTRDWDDKFTSKFRHALQPKPLLPLATEIERILFGDVTQDGMCTGARGWGGGAPLRMADGWSRQCKRPGLESPLSVPGTIKARTSTIVFGG
ncbi:kinase-like domain-containing protein [Mycena olivaceomarginata]|nr:kinase-like domain-containing protein [Mycena olivaceomarginata]